MNKKTFLRFWTSKLTLKLKDFSCYAHLSENMYTSMEWYRLPLAVNLLLGTFFTVYSLPECSHLKGR